MPAHEILGKWESFYVIVGSSAGALTGLQFVVMAIVADQPGRGGHQEIAAFGTPTVVHFMAVLLIGAIISAPWEELNHVAYMIGLFGLTGIIYTAIITRRASEKVMVGDDVVVHVMEIVGNTVRVGIEAPRSTPIYREEIWHAVREENRAAAQAPFDLPTATPAA